MLEALANSGDIGAGLHLSRTIKMKRYLYAAPGRQCFLYPSDGEAADQAVAVGSMEFPLDNGDGKQILRTIRRHRSDRSGAQRSSGQEGQYLF